ncbi:MAG TPA: PIG-L family deacetylase [Candidatus Saccharimonadia bacterium]
MNIAQLGNLITIWAHPDDETYCCGATMAEAARLGQRVTCVTATALGRRDQELRAALAALSVDDMRLLGYEDAHCQEVAAAEAVSRLTAIIREVQPDSIITFAPDGWTGHPDHRAVSAWATAAHRQSGTSAKLYYWAVTPAWYELFNPRLCPNAYHDVTDTAVTPAGQLALTVQPDDWQWQRKHAAMRAHNSQIPGLIHAFGEKFLTRAHQSEQFVLANR